MSGYLNSSEASVNENEGNRSSADISLKRSEDIFITQENIVTMVLPYTCIFVLAVVGNLLVIITLAFNRRMRSVTNAFLINLAVSDLLLGVFCMPFSLIGLLMKQFIFGALMCRLVPYLQAVSVSVNSWTLVVVSVERYYAICHPLRSRGYRQSWGHVYKCIVATWVFSSLLMSPIALLSELQPLKDKSKFKCRESWPSKNHLIVFTLFLDLILLIIPLIIMIVTYSQIVVTIWRNISSTNYVNKEETSKVSPNSEICEKFANLDIEKKENAECEEKKIQIITFAEKKVETKVARNECQRSSRIVRGLKLRSSVDQRLVQKRQSRLIRMLFVVVIEFFVCWTPLHFLNTLALFNPQFVYRELGYTWISTFQLLAFFSCCTNPITYCFLNSKFRQSFLLLFKCWTNEIQRNIERQGIPPDDLSHSFVQNSSPNCCARSEPTNV